MAGPGSGCDPRPVDLSDDLPPRRPLFFPVVIATVFLTIIGMSAGLVLGARAEREAGDATAQAPQTLAPHTQEPSVRTSRQPCRPETQVLGRRAGANGTLWVVLKVRTVSSTVWICSDADDELYYHANRGGDEAEWIEDTTALFLPGVVASGGGYRARSTNGDGRVTVFDVTRQRLAIRHGQGKTEIQPVRAVLVG